MPKYLAALVLALSLTASPLAAQTPAASSIAGVVRDHDGAPIAAAAVEIQGPVKKSMVTDAQGVFRFAGVPAGFYSIIVTKAGFSQYESSDVAAFTGETANLNVTLVQSSFSSLKTIATVSTNAPGRAQINTSTAAISTISNEVFADQGQVQVSKVLNETPGIISSGTSEAGNGADEGSPQVVQIRGALPYETESLIDGHPTPVALSGVYNPIYLNPALLQDVEVVKGPGAMPSEINYAIGGTVNYRTLEPTRTPQQSVTLGIDNWGGIVSAFRATGSTKTHRLDYAFGYATNGAPGPLRDYQMAGSQVPLVVGGPPWTVNGQQIAGVPLGVGPPPASWSKYIALGAQFQEPLYVCCFRNNTSFNSNAELMKLRFNLSQASALTVSYLGGQGMFPLGNGGVTSLQPVGTTGTSFSIFAPPPGYAGSVPAGTPIPFDLNGFPGRDWAQNNLFQAEFRTTFGPVAALARYFSGYGSEYQAIFNGKSTNYTFSGNTWGGIPLCPSGAAFSFSTGNCTEPNGTIAPPVMTYFNGQPATFGTTSVGQSNLEQDHLRGESVLLDRPMENGSDFRLGIDRSHHDSTLYVNNPNAGTVGYQLPPGSGQDFTTEMLYGRIPLSRHFFGDLADYFVQYSSHFTGDGGATWHDATHGYNAPRVAFSWRPNRDIAWRLAAGASIAPPYVSLLSSPGSQPAPNIVGAPTAYTENANNGQIEPETAFGYDLGLDKRIAVSTSVSIDLYLENLRNEFLPETYVDGTYSPGNGQPALPLYVSKTANLGHARYQGVEFAIQKTPIVGVGYKLQGSLQRAYTYDLPPAFYDTVAGPNTTNLGIIPNINFQASGLGWNTLNGVSVPYSMGYAEINDRTARGVYYNLGLTYFGSNNSYSQPAFFIMSGAWRMPLGHGTSLQLSIDNLLGTNNASWTSYLGGIPAPLENGQLGPTVGGNYGPTSWRLSITRTFGTP